MRIVDKKRIVLVAIVLCAVLFALTGCSAQTGNEIHIICEAVETDLISQR